MLSVGPTPPRPAAVTVGGRCALGTAAVWLLCTITGLPPGVWSSTNFGAARWPFGVVAVVFALLALATLARSPRAWLLLQLLSTLTVLLAGAALWSVVSGSARRSESWVVGLMAATGSAQLVSIVLLNQRRSRRWCRVDPEGYRTFFWQ